MNRKTFDDTKAPAVPKLMIAAIAMARLYPLPALIETQMMDMGIAT